MRILQFRVAAQDQVVLREWRDGREVVDHRRISVLDQGDEHHWNYLETRMLARLLSYSVVLSDAFPELMQQLFACLYYTNSEDMVWRYVLYEHLTRLLRAWLGRAPPRDRDYTLEEKLDEKICPRHAHSRGGEAAK